jgi:hypothetical protein
MNCERLLKMYRTNGKEHGRGVALSKVEVATRATRIVQRSLFITHEMGIHARFWLILFFLSHLF